MRVALVQAPAWGAIAPLGPATLKAYLEAQGHEARCFDLNIEFYNEHQKAKQAIEAGGMSYGGPDPWGADSYGQWALDYDRASEGEIAFQPGSVYNDKPLPLDRWADQVLAFEPRVVGFTTYLTSFPASLLLAQLIKDRDPTVLVVFGGPNVAQDREGDIALRTGIPDLVVHGEGEVALHNIVAALEASEDPTCVRGTGHLADGVATWTEPEPLIKQLDALPYADFGDVTWTDYPNPYQIPIMASRGCILSCSFCYETVYWKRFRTQSPERIVAEIEHQKRQHPLTAEAEADGRSLYFMFGDSLINGHMAGLRRLCELLIERDANVSWGGQATIDKRMDAELCQLLHTAGCTGLAFGLESGSQPVLAAMGKRFNIEDAVAVIRNLHDAGMSPTVNVMVGFPTERLRDFLATIRFLTRTRKWIYQVSNVTTTQVALGSEMHLFPEKYGVTVHPNGSWESAETGGEGNRRSRLRFLHRWMRLVGVPHQNIAPPDPSDRENRIPYRERRAHVRKGPPPRPVRVSVRVKAR